MFASLVSSRARLPCILTSHYNSVCGLQSNKMRDVILAMVGWLFSFWTWFKAVFILRWFKASVLGEARSDPSLSDTIRPDGIVKISESVYLLSEPEGPPEMDIVFLHGFQLFGNRNYWRTWMSDDEDNKETVCWPMTWLKEDFPKARISSLSIDLFLDPYVLAKRLVQELVEFAKIGQQKHCPDFVFVCHSYGGRVAKNIVIQAHLKFGNDPKYVDFLENINGFFFYSTPHEGSWIDDAVEEYPSYLDVSKIFDTFQFMRYDYGHLDTEFDRIEREYYANRWEFYVVAEARETNISSFKGMVVDKASARHVYKNFLMVPSDHFGVCKPKCKTSINYLALKNFISHAMSDHRPNISASEERELKLMVKHKISHHELYDNRQITIFRVGDRGYLQGTIFDNSVLNNIFSETRSSILDILCKMEELVEEVKIWHNQCRHFLARYRNGVDKIVQTSSFGCPDRQE